MSTEKKAAVYPFLIFKEAWGVCRRNLAKLGVVYLFFYIPYLLLVLLATLVPGDQSMILGIISTLIGLLSGVTLLVAAKRAVASEPVSIGKSLLGAKKYFLSYLGVALVIFLTIFAMLFLGGAMIAIGVILVAKSSLALTIAVLLTISAVVIYSLVHLMVRWALASAACVLEEKPPIAALKRSWALVRGYVNPLVGEYCLFIVAGIIAIIPYSVALVLLGNPQNGREPEALISAVNNIVINSILVPLISVAIVILYNKLKEANEINVRAQ